MKHRGGDAGARLARCRSDPASSDERWYHSSSLAAHAVITRDAARRLLPAVSASEPRFDPLGVVSAPIAIFWVVVGAAAGVLVCALVARHRLAAARRAYGLQLRRREGAIDRFKAAMKEQAARLKRQQEQLRELETLRHERAVARRDLERMRRELEEFKSTLEATRSAAREADLRLNAALDAERQDAAARRAASAAELAAAQETVLNLRAELAAARDASSRTIARLEADLASTRSLLDRTMQELNAERAAAAEGRSELLRRITALEDERSKLEAALAAERHANAEKQASLRSFVTTLREQYALACAERDAAQRDAAAQRSRAEEAEAALQRERDEFRQRLDSEHEESVALISRVWDYVHNYPRLRERPAHGPPEPPPPAPRPGHAQGTGTPPAGGDPFLEALGGPGSASTPAAPVTTDREVPQPPNKLADAPSRESGGYDIERALAGEEAPAGPAAQPELRPRPTATLGTTRVRRPVSAMRRDQDVLVICDDGSVWTKRPTGWTEERPIPGSEVDVSQRLADKPEE